jgi:hypothetical protein
LLSASRRRAARAWLALMVLGSDARPARWKRERSGELEGLPGRPGCRCASEASAISAESYFMVGGFVYTQQADR